ncbi:MAG: rhomboid family intramembrane serine protease [Candidatus Aenigmarchaeota archaeon]|nr:rhomboid family intramembrane serine protease [Candidatus Aenigmarchaeota archaeon]
MAGKKETKTGILTLTLIALNVALFLIVFSAPETIRTGLFDRLSLSQGTALQLWRWITSMFLHASATHLFFNMIGLYFFGRLLEKEVKPQWFLSIYFVSGLLGGLAFILTSAVPVVGASGAIFGLMGAVMLLRPLEKVYVFLFPLPLGIVAALFIITEGFVAYYQPGFGNVAHIAHIGGIVTGSLFALSFNPAKALKGLFMLGLLVAVVIILYPVFGLLADIGQSILGIIDMVVGFFLYGAASLLSFLWR